MVEIHKYSVKQGRWLPHFRTFCELVEGEENKLTTFSTWTIMLGCNESNNPAAMHTLTHSLTHQLCEKDDVLGLGEPEGLPSLLEPAGLSGEDLLEWLFLLDTLNFCFW